MIHMKPTTKNVITALEVNLNDVMKGELYQAVIREELDYVVIQFPFKRNSDGVPTWSDMLVTVYSNGAFEEKYKEKEDSK